jgi:hypothetical protein
VKSQAKLPSAAERVFKQIHDWRSALDSFDREKIERAAGVYEIKGTDGRVGKIPDGDYRLWKLQVFRMSKEADARAAASDWAWFEWIDEYASMVAATMLDDFDEQFTVSIEKGGRAIKSQRKASAAGAASRKKIGKHTKELDDAAGFEANEATVPVIRLMATSGG